MKYYLSFLIIIMMLALTSCVNSQETSDGSITSPAVESPSAIPSQEVEATIIPSTDEAPSQTAVYSLTENLSINAKSTPELILGQTWSSGNYTICDFSIMPDNSVLILDGKTGRIYRFGNGELISIYDYDLGSDYLPHKIACDSAGNIFLVAAKYNYFLKIDKDEKIHFSKFDGFDLASVTEFTVDENNQIAVTVFDSEISDTKTYILDISMETAVIKDTITGTIADRFICRPTHLKDPDDELERQIGHRLRIELFNLNSDGILDVVLSSDNWLLGAVCYGKDGNEYVFKLVELDDEDNFYNTLVFVDNTGAVTSRYSIPQGYFLLKSFDGNLLLFTQSATEIQISPAFSTLELIK